jgi:exonuclease SbcD
MRFACTGDLHRRKTNPENRIDNYFETQLEKERFIFDASRTHNCDWILRPGDVFHRHDAPHGVVEAYIRLHRHYGFYESAVFGQHDMRNHTSERKNTPLGVLLAGAGRMHHATETPLTPIIWSDEKKKSTEENIYIYGASYGEEIPEIQDQDGINILVLHKMVIQTKLWYAQEEYVSAKALLRHHRYDLIVSGDNHTSFVEEFKGRFLVNCGSLMRSTLAQVEHKPMMAIYDTDKRTIKTIDIPIRPIEEVMNLKEAEKNDKVNKELQSFITQLQSDKSLSMDFMDNVLKFTRRHKLKPAVVNLIVQACKKKEREKKN